MKCTQDFTCVRAGDLLVRLHGFAVALELFDMTLDHSSTSGVTAIYLWTTDCGPKRRGEMTRVDLMTLYGCLLVR